MSAIVVSKKAFNAFRYFTLLFALIAVIGFGASVKLHFDANNYKEAYEDASEKIVDINKQLRDVEQEKKLLEDKLKKKTVAEAKAKLATKIRTVARSGEAECMAAAIYHEAGGEHNDGKWAVAQVVLNRMKNGAFPNTACGVVYQGAHDDKPGCQFSWACDGMDKAIKVGSTAWQESKRIAVAVLSGQQHAETSGALYFHNASVRPRWATKDRFVARIGGHFFYR